MAMQEYRIKKDTFFEKRTEPNDFCVDCKALGALHFLYHI